MQRLKHHFEPSKGWINDPNGLIYFAGRYHAFFQYNPHSALEIAKAHWGHTVSDDLIHWEELPIALYPDNEYETIGCWSGSAIEKEGKMYLFYTSHSEKYGQTQSVAVSEDGISFTKYENNPVIARYPADGSPDFRDPKVSLIDGKYYMVCGSGKDGVGKILLYTSENLFDWTYIGVLYEDNCATVFECPDFFKIGENYLLMFSRMCHEKDSAVFVCGTFDGKKLMPLRISMPESGPSFFAPQTFEDEKGRRLLIAWMSRWSTKIQECAKFSGALTIPREITVDNGAIKTFPVTEAAVFLTEHDPCVSHKGGTLTVNKGGADEVSLDCGEVHTIKILKDTTSIEVFVNGGQYSATCRISDELA